MLSRKNQIAERGTVRTGYKGSPKEHALFGQTVKSWSLDHWVSIVFCMRPTPVIRRTEKDIRPGLQIIPRKLDKNKANDNKTDKEIETMHIIILRKPFCPSNL
jgi:hypothetical protein